MTVEPPRGLREEVDIREEVDVVRVDQQSVRKSRRSLLGHIERHRRASAACQLCPPQSANWECSYGRRRNGGVRHRRCCGARKHVLCLSPPHYRNRGTRTRFAKAARMVASAPRRSRKCGLLCSGPRNGRQSRVSDACEFGKDRQITGSGRKRSASCTGSSRTAGAEGREGREGRKGRQGRTG